MAVTVLRPNATISNTAPLAGPSAHAALADNSDSTYVEQAQGQETILGFADFTLPSGAIIIGAAVRCRVNQSTGYGGGPAVSITTVWPGLGSSEVFINFGDLRTIETLTFGDGVGDADLDAAQIGFYFSEGDPGDRLRIYEAYLDARYVGKPTVTVSAPSGTITTNNRPPVQWPGGIDADGGLQTRYEVKVFDAATYGAGGFDPATSTAVQESLVKTGNVVSWQMPDPLANGTYRAYVRRAQTVNGTLLWSDFAYSQFTTNVSPPPAPNITATADSANGRVTLALSDNSGVSTDAYEIQRSDDAGITFVPVRHEDGYDVPLVASDPTVYDYEAPNGVAVRYRARALHNYGGYAAGSWATAAPVTWTSRLWWFKHPNFPELNVSAETRTEGPVTRPARGGIFQGLGAHLPISISDTRGGPQGSIIALLYTRAELNAIDRLLDAPGVLLLQASAIADEPDRYVAFGDVSHVRSIDKEWIPVREVTMPWSEVSAPGGSSGPMT